MSQQLIVYVPVAGSTAAQMIRPRSAVIGYLSKGERVDAYLQDDGPVGDFARFANRAMHAADRLCQRYPTIARLAVPATELRRVGVYDQTAGEVLLDDQPSEQALAAWLEQDQLDPAELHTDGVMRHDLRRGIAAARASGDPVQRQLADQLARQHDLDR